MIRMRNARIEEIMLGFEDHGEFTFILYLDLGGSSQGFGCRANINAEHIKTVIRTLSGNYGTWEGLKGKYVRAIHTSSEVVAIGRLMENKWLEPGNDWFVGRLEDLACYADLSEAP